jgi:hypothetical protein
MLLRDGGIRDSSPASIASEIRKLRDSKKDRAGVKNCIMFGPLEVGAKVLEDELRIEDTAEQAKAMFALMPYLPRTFPREILDQVSNPNVVGSQIAGLAEIIKELILALSAGVLTEVVESASQLHSEWWVVEALTSTLVRIRERGEFAAVLRASRGIRNLDLRARIVSRVAVRAADFGNVRFAIDAALTIELPPLRWEALGELAIRFASIGDTDSADAAASEIVPGEDRSRAYMGIALEVAAQSKLSRARLIGLAPVSWTGEALGSGYLS